MRTPVGKFVAVSWGLAFVQGVDVLADRRVGRNIDLVVYDRRNRNRKQGQTLG